MRKAVWWGGGALVLALIGMFVASLLNQPSDKQLILQALDESIAASRAGRPGGVLEYLSRNLTWNGDEGVNRMEIADYIKRAKPEVTVMHREVVLDGDTATITTPVNVKLSMPSPLRPRAAPRISSSPCASGALSKWMWKAGSPRLTERVGLGIDQYQATIANKKEPEIVAFGVQRINAESLVVGRGFLGGGVGCHLLGSLPFPADR